MMDAAGGNSENNNIEIEKSVETIGEMTPAEENNSSERQPDGAGDATAQSESDDDVR